ncbi:hypothetical protein FNV58_01120 (plasmid) [Streptomyces sp. RLB1-9]|uniref:hypothetical protein n=1 Tax=Streptomyces sp. RLB1-9 TaxID=2594454 RepID=UPI0011623B7E|nr:hypothetical protein [Streptomyces sp. RLB1-9]QDN94962.1 hypothetical protein FNV58_01120 [Streptomyces sp. RLB1-9]
MGIPKVDEATTIALEAIRDAAPGLLTMTEVSKKVASHADVSIGTARNRLRAAVAAGGLLELTPETRKFFVDLPGEKTAGVGPFYIAQEWTGTGREHRKVITTDDSKMRPSSYGPGNTTYLADPEQIREYVQQLADEQKAKREAEIEAAKAEKKAEKKEFGRRFPGLLRTLRRFRLLGTEIREHRGRFASVKTSTHLEDEDRRGKEALAIEERDASLTIYAWGDENVALLNSLLTAGIAAHIESQPLTLCAHCGGRILQVPQGEDGGFWWHIDSTSASCAQGDTKAEPAQEN